MIVWIFTILLDFCLNIRIFDWIHWDLKSFLFEFLGFFGIFV